MKKFLVKYRFFLIMFSFVYVYLLFILICPTQFGGITPYGLNNVSNNIQISTDYTKNDDSFYTISVLSFNTVTAFQKLVLDSLEFGETYPNTAYSHISGFDREKMGQIEKESSYYTSIIIAFLKAQENDPSINIGFEFRGVKVHYIPKKLYKSQVIKVGDIITSITSNTITYDAASCNTLFDIYNFMNALKNSKYSIKVGNKDINLDLSSESYYLDAYPIFNLSPSIDINLPGLNSLTGGPSGGLMQSLYIYSTLMKLDFSKYKICGTGTIEITNEVGKIGGAKEKFKSALDAHADFFFVPAANFPSIENIMNKYQGQITIFVVNNFSDAVNKLLTLL